MNLGQAQAGADHSGGLLHRHAGPEHQHQGDRRDRHVAPGAPGRGDGLVQFEFFLVHGDDEPAGPRGRQRQAAQALAGDAEQGDVRDQDRAHQEQSDTRADHAEGGQQAPGGDPDGDRAAQEHDPAVQGDLPGHHRAQAQQCGEVEHVRAQDHPGADAGVVVQQGGDRRGDLRGVGGQGGDHAEQGLGQADALAQAFQAHHQQPAGAQAQPGGQDEEHRPHGCRHARSPAPYVVRVADARRARRKSRAVVVKHSRACLLSRAAGRGRCRVGAGWVIPIIGPGQFTARRPRTSGSGWPQSPGRTDDNLA
jgi:hypothetical protein